MNSGYWQVDCGSREASGCRPQSDSHPAHVNRGAHDYPHCGTAKACAALGAAFPENRAPLGTSRILWAFLNRRLSRRRECTSGSRHARRTRRSLDKGGTVAVAADRHVFAGVLPELSKLQHRAEGFPTAIARKIIEEDLGSSRSRCFSITSMITPFATASIGQIHRAHLRREGDVGCGQGPASLSQGKVQSRSSTDRLDRAPSSDRFKVLAVSCAGKKRYGN